MIHCKQDDHCNSHSHQIVLFLRQVLFFFATNSFQHLWLSCEYWEMKHWWGCDIRSHVDARKILEGNMFCNKKILKTNLTFYALQNKFELMCWDKKKNEYVVECAQSDCKWIFKSSRLRATKMFKIREMSSGHPCSMYIILGSHWQTSSSIVSNNNRYKNILSRTINTPSDISNVMSHKYRVSMNYVKAWRTRGLTLKLIRCVI